MMRSGLRDRDVQAISFLETDLFFLDAAFHGRADRFMVLAGTLPGGEDAFPYGGSGDLLWVREPWRFTSDRTGVASHPMFEYLADYRGVLHTGPWRRPVDMPREASRLTLLIIWTRPMRVGDVTGDDMAGCGVQPGAHGGLEPAWRALWRMKYGMEGADPAARVWNVGIVPIPVQVDRVLATPEIIREAFDDARGGRLDGPGAT